MVRFETEEIFSIRGLKGLEKEIEKSFGKEELEILKSKKFQLQSNIYPLPEMNWKKKNLLNKAPENGGKIYTIITPPNNIQGYLVNKPEAIYSEKGNYLKNEQEVNRTIIDFKTQNNKTIRFLFHHE
jgi:hypothetical protein